MKYDIDLLNRYIKEGWVVKNNHPSLPIAIYNYTRTCSFDKNWDEITMSCRGLVLDNEGNVIARPFPKFFNMEEMQNIPDEEFEVFEKMDGSLGIIFKYNDRWILASRGSFASDQAIMGAEMMIRYNLNGLNPYYTYVVEIIYPENRIVVNYGDREELVLLGAIDPDSGFDIPYDWLKMTSESTGMGIMKQFPGNYDFKTLKSFVPDNNEGYVLRFKSGVRMKIKGEEYCRLHRVLTMFSNIDIWNCLANNDQLDKFLDRVPDEYDEWVHVTKNNLVSDFANELQRLKDLIKEHDFPPMKEGDLQNKTKVMNIRKKVNKTDAGMIISLLKGKSVDKYIWSKIRPEYQKPFWLK